jgi:hypothetical protein
VSELDDIKREAELQLDLNDQMWDNHQKRCEESIMNLAALIELRPDELELLKAMVGNQQ